MLERELTIYWETVVNTIQDGIIGVSAPMQKVFDLIVNASHSDAPVIIYGESGTGKDLVERGVFREDLFYRINVIPVGLPPLRDRAVDMPLLADSFLRRMQLKNDKKIHGIANESMGLLMGYTWPGNVRELKSAFEYAFVTCRESLIKPYHLPPAIYRGSTTLKTRIKLSLNRDEVKKRQLIEALEQAGGNQSRAAQMLGVSRVTVCNRMNKYGLPSKPKFSAEKIST
jgi:transcriptional regulator with PAS, ATPase and Fis domain